MGEGGLKIEYLDGPNEIKSSGPYIKKCSVL